MRNNLIINQMGGFGVCPGTLKTFGNALKAQSLHRWMFSKCRGIWLKNGGIFKKKEPVPGSSSGAGSCVHGHVKT